METNKGSCGQCKSCKCIRVEDLSDEDFEAIMNSTVPENLEYLNGEELFSDIGNSIDWEPVDKFFLDYPNYLSEGDNKDDEYPRHKK